MTLQDLEREIQKHSYYPKMTELMEDRARALETCNEIEALFHLLLKKRATLNKNTTHIRIDFEKLLPTRYVGKSHLLLVYSHLGYTIKFKSNSAYYYDCNVSVNKRLMKQHLAKPR